MTATQLEDLGDKTFRDLEVGIDGIDLTDRGQQGRFTGADKVADASKDVTEDPS